MSKLTYIKEAMASLNINELPSDQGLSVLPKLYDKQYFELSEIGEHLESLLEFGLIEKSSNMVTRTLLTDEIMDIASLKFMEAEHPDKLEKRPGANKRVIGEDMKSYKDYAVEYLKGKIEIKEVIEYRSNFFINFDKKIKGLGGLEIKNKPEIRVCIRKPTPETIEHFASIGMTYRSATNQTYFDMKRSEENIEKLIDAIVSFFAI